MTYDLDRFIADADAAATAGYGPETVAVIEAMLRRLAAEWDGLDRDGLSSLHGDAAGASVIARGEHGSVLMLARFPSEAPTPVHNHNSWGIVYVLEGRDHYERWRRHDDLSDVDRANVSLEESLQLETGDTVSFPPPPNDLHAQQGIGGASWELVFFAADPNRDRRAYFDPEAGTVEYDRAMD